MEKAAMGFFTGIIILSGVGAWWYLENQRTISATNTPPATELPPSDDTPVRHPSPVGASIGDENLVQFACDSGKSITAVFARDIVGLTLSDGRQMELRQVETARGIRFHNIDGSIEFHGEGDAGFLIEGETTTYANCLASR